jgi:hypothetical protein
LLVQKEAADKLLEQASKERKLAEQELLNSQAVAQAKISEAELKAKEIIKCM